MIHVGILKKERKYTGRADRIDFMMTTRPLIDNWLFFHFDNLDMTASITDCHMLFLLRVAPIGSPRYFTV
jgi:hypothetical protein